MKQCITFRHKQRLLATVIAAAITGVTVAPVMAAEQTSEKEIESITVTGSRIVKEDFAFSNPVVTVNSEAIEQSGVTNMSEFLAKLPALAASSTSFDSGADTSGAGLSFLNLRNLGTNRTLVLVNGRRHVAGEQGSAAVDINSIPVNLIDRVEVLTGGASALYGADGVSGVVNFIMKRDYEGFDISARTGQSDHGDAQSNLLSITWGKNFDAGNITLAFEHSQEQRLDREARDFSSANNRVSFLDNPADANDDPNVPDQIPFNDVRYYDSAPGSAIWTAWSDPDYVPEFLGNGSPWAHGAGVLSSYFTQGGSGVSTTLYRTDLQPKVETNSINALINYELFDAVNFYSEFKYVRSEAEVLSEPNFDLYVDLDVTNNPFAPQNIKDSAITNGGGWLTYSRDHLELGILGGDNNRDTVRAVLGFEGEFNNGFTWDVSYVYGQTKSDEQQSNVRINDRWNAGIDAVVDPTTGNYVCASDLGPTSESDTFTMGANSGCQVINIFGAGTISQEAAEWAALDLLSQSTIKQQVMSGYITGDSAEYFELPAGAIDFSVGAEWRKEESDYNPPAEYQKGFTDVGRIAALRGEFSVREVFGEVSIPVLEGITLAQSLYIDAAVRYSDYSTIGDATTWKYGLSWAPIDDILVRGTVSKATRAPNIGELFAAESDSLVIIYDPCDSARIDEGTEFREKNCATLLSSYGVADPSSYLDPNHESVRGRTSGNGNLSEEDAKSRTLGVVFKPRFINNFNFSIDWYDIEITKAITTPTPGDAAKLCVDLESLDNPFCSLLTRSAENGGGVVTFVQQSVNVAAYRTRGIDFNLDYLFNPQGGEFGDFALNLVGNHLNELTYIDLPGAAPRETIDEEGAPEWQLTSSITWKKDDLTIRYGFDYFSETYRFDRTTRTASPDKVAPQYMKYSAKASHELYAGYYVNDKLNVYVGVNNLTNEKPDIGEVAYPVGPVGRFFYLGFNYSL